MRCPSCNKFPSLEAQDPELDISIDDDEEGDTTLHLTGNVRCVLNAGCCGDEMKEANFDVDAEADLPERKEGHVHDYRLTDDGGEATETGGGRYKKNLRGYRVTLTITCAHEGCDLNIEHELEDSLQASAWDELN